MNPSDGILAELYAQWGIAPEDQKRMTEEGERLRARAQQSLLSKPDATTLAELLGPLRRIQESLAQRMAKTVCGGLTVNVDSCSWSNERECVEKASNSCPKRILEYEASIKASMNGGDRTLRQVLTGQGVPVEIAQFVADGHEGKVPFDEETRAMRLVKTFITDKKRAPYLLLAGGTGNGKSTAAGWAIKEQGGQWLSAYEIATNCRKPGYLQSFLSVSLLVVDELGGEDANSSCVSAMNELIYSRGSTRTILTSNVTREDMVARYSERFVDRVTGSGIAFIVGGGSMRGR